MKRRQFLARTLQTTLVAAPLLRVGVVCADSLKPLPGHESETLRSVLDLLFPASPDSPGARELRVAEWVELEMVDPDVDSEEREALRKGVAALDRYCREQHGKRWLEISREQHDAVLRGFADDGGGGRWVALLLDYTLEALFGDPVYGVNAGGVGWKWIGHQPGFPPPPKPKWYRGI